MKDLSPVKRFVTKNFLKFAKFDDEYSAVLDLGNMHFMPLEESMILLTKLTIKFN